MSTIIDKIISLEFAMFQHVQNVGGRAGCQDNYETFRIMRASQFEAWTDKVLASYLKDLQQAKAQDQNLVFYKYAYMIRDRCAEEYEHLRDVLPPVAGDKRDLIALLTSIHLSWMEELAVRYPALITKSRPLHTAEDTPFSVSSETYIRCELMTYSMATLDLYSAQLLSYLKSGQNMNELILLNTVEKYQYHSLEEAENYLRGKKRESSAIIFPGST